MDVTWVLPLVNMFYKRVILLKQGLHKRIENCRVFYVRQASFGQLGLISDPQISSKLQNGINDPKGLENKLYTIMKGRETFYGDHTVPISPAVAKFNMFYNRFILWKQGLPQRTEKRSVHKFSGPD